MRNSIKFGTVALLIAILSLVYAARSGAVTFYTTYNPFIRNFDYYAQYGPTDNFTAYNASVSVMCIGGICYAAWPVDHTHDQSLNTTSGPTFQNLTITDNIVHSGNITNPNNSTWGIYNNGSCIVIGDLSYISECG